MQNLPYILSGAALLIAVYAAFIKKTKSTTTVTTAKEGLAFIKKEGVKTFITDSEGNNILEL